MTAQRRVRVLSAEVARKIAAGEVIDRPGAIVRELMDNAVDSGASRIRVEITGGGIEKIRVIDNGCGMTREDLLQCAQPHATSKIETEADLLSLSTLGFRGEALSSMAAVSRLELASGGWKLNACAAEERTLTQCAQTEGTIAQTAGLFEDFPARRQFLKRPASEGMQCRTVFEEKALPRPDISFSFASDGEEKITLPAGQSLKERFVQTMNFFETEDLFYELNFSSQKNQFSFSLIIGEPSVTRSSRKDIFIYVNGRKIQEYSLVQAIAYGAQGYFPNGTFPVACLFVQMDASLVDFNIHPAKKEARFKDINALHHAVSSTARAFFRQHTVQSMLAENSALPENKEFSFFTEKNQEEAGCSVEETAIHRPVSVSARHLGSMPAYSGIRRSGRGSFFPAAQETHPFSKKWNEEEMQPQVFQPEENAASVSEPRSFHFAGCVLGTFLLAEKNDVLYIIDQHAAHERILYNKIMAEAGKKQQLLVPYVIQTDSETDDKYLQQIQPRLEEAGYECASRGSGKWEFTAVPVRWKGSEADLKKDVLDRRIQPADIINAAAASAACRSAVMDGTVLDDETAARIAREALSLPDPHCPHGRPVFTAITRKQLFALVKRT
ncbi:MAG: DNA mismatch repair endonuclease MutL [Treponema sp.]|nr:DNA mismatch repair endonuclease MutL [Treponema sp.]